MSAAFTLPLNTFPADLSVDNQVAKLRVPPHSIEAESSVLGGLFGLFIGIILVLIQQQLQVIMITPSLAYPVDFLFKNVIINLMLPMIYVSLFIGKSVI